MYHYEHKIILRTALLLNVCNQTILDKNYLKMDYSIGFVIHATIQSLIQNYSYLSILINICFSIWCKSDNLNDKNVLNIYFMAILVRIMKIHIGDVINRPPWLNAPHVQSANKLHLKGN